MYIVFVDNPALRKVYRPTYIWGQLSGWFKQTVSDPTASLSAERRGTVSLPDIECCFGSKGRYGIKERNELLEHLERRPDSSWKAGSIWSFRNESRVYGSPMLDTAWLEITGEGEDSLAEVLRELRTADTPFNRRGTRNTNGTSGVKGKQPSATNGNKGTKQE